MKFLFYPELFRFSARGEVRQHPSDPPRAARRRTGDSHDPPGQTSETLATQKHRLISRSAAGVTVPTGEHGAIHGKL